MHQFHFVSTITDSRWAETFSTIARDDRGLPRSFRLQIDADATATMLNNNSDVLGIFLTGAARFYGSYYQRILNKKGYKCHVGVSGCFDEGTN